MHTKGMSVCLSVDLEFIIMYSLKKKNSLNFKDDYRFRLQLSNNCLEKFYLKLCVLEKLNMCNEH